HLSECWKPNRSWKRQHGRFPRNTQVNRTLRLAHRYLQQPADSQARIVRVFETMVELGVLPENSALIARLLHPIDERIAAARHLIWKRPRARAGRHEDRAAIVPRGVNGSALMKRADIHVHGCGGRLSRHHRVTDGG